MAWFFLTNGGFANLFVNFLREAQKSSRSPRAERGVTAGEVGDELRALRR